MAFATLWPRSDWRSMSLQVFERCATWIGQPWFVEVGGFIGCDAPSRAQASTAKQIVRSGSSEPAWTLTLTFWERDRQVARLPLCKSKWLKHWLLHVASLVTVTFGPSDKRQGLYFGRTRARQCQRHGSIRNGGQMLFAVCCSCGVLHRPNV